MPLEFLQVNHNKSSYACPCCDNISNNLLQIKIALLLLNTKKKILLILINI